MSSNEEIDDFRSALSSFAAREIVPLREERQLSRETLRTIVRSLADLGYLGAGGPSPDGLGLHGDIVLVETLAKQWGALASSLVPTLTAQWLVETEGTDPLAWGLSLSPTDVQGSVGTLGWVVNGATALRVVVVGSGAVSPLWETSDVATELEMDGLQEVSLAEVVAAPVPSENNRAGQALASRTVRLLTAATLAGLSRGAIDLAVPYVCERIQFGAPIGTYGEIRAIIAEALVASDTVATLIHDAARGGPKADRKAAVALHVACSAALEVVDRCQHTHGGYGHMAEYEIGRFVRDAHLLATLSTPKRHLDEELAVAAGLPAAAREAITA